MDAYDSKSGRFRHTGRADLHGPDRMDFRKWRIQADRQDESGRMEHTVNVNRVPPVAVSDIPRKINLAVP